MKNEVKNIFVALSVFAIIFIISCSDNVLETGKKSAEVIEELSVVNSRIQFGIDKVYYYKIAVESNYLPSDSLFVKAYFTNGIENVGLALYDDGITDDSLRNDLVASNNIWSGGINSYDFPNEGDWQLNIDILTQDSIVISEHIFKDILVHKNTAPQINSIIGIAEGDTLFSGFDTKNLTISITDPDNVAPHNDNQTLRLEIRNRENIPKDYEFVREDPLGDMVISLDSTLASGLATNDNYNLTFIATDSFGESDSLSLSNIRIENTAPTVYDLLFPDTVFIPQADSIYFSITTNVNDPQGHLESQDIQNVELILDVSGTPYSYEMRDDGDFNNSGDITADDGIYTKNFKVNSTNSADIYPFTIFATDKVGNLSETVSDTLIFVKETKLKIYRENNVQKFNYSNPFNTK